MTIQIQGAVGSVVRQRDTNGLALSFWPGTNVLTNGFTIGSDGSGIIQAHGMFDDLVTFSYPLDASTISGMFLNGVVYFLLNPANAPQQGSGVVLR